MSTDFHYPSAGGGQIHARRWEGEGPIRVVVQIVHGIAEHMGRYDDFARYLNSLGCLVVAEDHMGHGGSVGEHDVKGSFRGGWFNVVEDTYALLRRTMEEFPGVPYILFGHSMGSFIVRSILCLHPNSGITGCILSGTAWKGRTVPTAGVCLCNAMCKVTGEHAPAKLMAGVALHSYNRRVEHKRTEYDWTTRDEAAVDRFVEDPDCGFVGTNSLFRDMLTGMRFNEDPANLAKMNKNVPVFFLSGGDDPVGDYGKGVRKAAAAFQKAGVRDVEVYLLPLARHELLNEWNREETYRVITDWLEKKIN